MNEIKAKRGSVGIMERRKKEKIEDQEKSNQIVLEELDKFSKKLFGENFDYKEICRFSELVLDTNLILQEVEHQDCRISDWDDFKL